MVVASATNTYPFTPLPLNPCLDSEDQEEEPLYANAT
jgi:hypothetical protein